MAINETEKIDMFAVERCSGESMLYLTDHLPWHENEDDEEHLYLIQEKINTYLSFIESGQLFEETKADITKKINVVYVSKYATPKEHQHVFDLFSKILEASGYGFIMRVDKD